MKTYNHITEAAYIEFNDRHHPYSPHVLTAYIEGGAGTAVFCFHLARVGWVSLFDVADGWPDWDAVGIVGDAPPWPAPELTNAAAMEAMRRRARWDEAHAVEVEAARRAGAEARRYLKTPSAVEWADPALVDEWAKDAPRMAVNTGAVGFLQAYVQHRVELWRARFDPAGADR